MIIKAPSLYWPGQSKKWATFLSSYLAGLIEGDGTIVVPKKERSDKGKLNYPCIQIVFHLRDFPLCQVIQKLLGLGTISKKKQSAAYILTINNLEGLIVVTRLINGKMMRACEQSKLLCSAKRG